MEVQRRRHTGLACNRCHEYVNKLEQKELECKELEKKLDEKTEHLKAYENVLEPACSGLMSLNEKLEEEQRSRHDAEILVKKTRADYAKLKRQSQVLARKLGPALDIDMEKDCGRNEPLEIRLAETETERDFLKIKLEREQMEFAEKLDSLKVKNYDLIKKNIDLLEKNEELKGLINRFRRTSTLAMQEYSKLQEQVAEEVAKKEDAQRYAIDCSAREKTLRHQSALFMTPLSSSSSSGDERVMKLLMEIEELSKELTMEREEHKKDVETLEGAIKASKDVEKVSSIETQLEIAKSEVERLHKSVLELETWKEAAAKEVDILRSKCEEVSITLPPPPAPPPPPCPPPPPSIPTNTSKVVKKSISNAVPAETSSHENLLSDLKDLMSKIKSGEKPGTKRVTSNKVERGLPPAMMELQAVLAKMKGKEGSHNSPSEKSPCNVSHKVTPPLTPKPKLNMNSRACTHSVTRSESKSEA